MTQSRQEKINLIKGYVFGKINVVNGVFIDKAVVAIKKGKDYFVNGRKVNINKVRDIAETMLILPDNGR